MLPIITLIDRCGLVVFESEKAEYTFGIDFAIVEAAHKLYYKEPGKFFNIIRDRANWMEKRVK